MLGKFWELIACVIAANRRLSWEITARWLDKNNKLLMERDRDYWIGPNSKKVTR